VDRKAPEHPSPTLRDGRSSWGSRPPGVHSEALTVAGGSFVLRGGGITRIILVGAAIVVAFDAVASLLLPWLGASLAWMFLGESLLYFGVGFASGRIGGLVAGARSGAAVAAVDATVGWAITWVIGTGRVSRLTPFGVAVVLLTMITTGVVAGSAGAFAARLLGRRSRAV